MSGFISLPERTFKPRQNGLTMMIDGGLGLRQIKDVLELGETYVDYVKLGWGTALVTPILGQKIDLYRKFGIRVCLGGTFFEVAHVQNKTEEYASFMKDLNIDLVEISDGTIDMEHTEKLRYIEQFAKDFTVLSEYGSKDEGVIKAPHYWVKHMQAELDAGSWKVIGEGRESGTAGMYRGSSELRTGLVDEIVDHLDTDQIIWEAPQKAQQAWFIKKFGTNVNLGNIAAKDVIPLETLRLGLRSDTLRDFHTSV